MGYAQIEMVKDSLVKKIAESDRSYLLLADEYLKSLALEKGVDIDLMCTTPIPHLIREYLKFKIGELICFDKMVVNPKKSYSEDVEFDSYSLGYQKYMNSIKEIERKITSKVFYGTADEGQDFGSMIVQIDRE